MTATHSRMELLRLFSCPSAGWRVVPPEGGRP